MNATLPVVVRPCECAGPGDCPVYDKPMSGREWELCSGRCPAIRPCPDETRQRYKDHWAAVKAGVKRAPRPATAASGGVTVRAAPPLPRSRMGTHLKALITKLGLGQPCGSCQGLADELDARGPAWARDNFDRLVAHLRTQQENLGWAAYLKVGWAAIWSGDTRRLIRALDPTDPAPGLLTRAIELAEADEAAPLALVTPPRPAVAVLQFPGGDPRPGQAPALPERDYPTARAVVAPAASPVLFNQTNLCPEAPGLRFNPSILPWRDGYLFAFRNGWRGSDVFVVPMDAGRRPLGPAIKLELFHSDANYGREDPRLFVFRGRLHVAYSGVVGGSQIRHTNVLYARIDEDLRVEQIYSPQFAGRNLWEKNWSFFEHAGRLYAVYSFAPHAVLAVDGDRAEVAYRTPTRAPWVLGTEIRGGASPVRVGDEWWCFFHSRYEEHGHRIYVTGLYTFDAEPPFRVRRIIPGPIDVADPWTKPRDQYASVVWAGGAARAGGDWVIATGIHDRWSELRTFRHADLESALVEVPS